MSFAYLQGFGAIILQFLEVQRRRLLHNLRMHPSDAVFSHVALGSRGAIATGRGLGFTVSGLGFPAAGSVQCKL